MVQKNHTLLRIYQNLHIHAVRVKILLSIFGLRHDSKPHVKRVVCVPAVRPLSIGLQVTEVAAMRRAALMALLPGMAATCLVVAGALCCGRPG